MNTFEEIDDIIAILNQERRVHPSNSSSLSTSTVSSEMVLDNSDSELIELLNESKASSSSSSSYYSTGPLDSLTSFKSVEKQCSSRRTSTIHSLESISVKFPEPTEEEIMDLLKRQHNLVNQLNHENIKLINENKRFKSQVKSKDSQLQNIQDSYASLLEQNKSLKEQLCISQVYNVAYLKQIKLSNKEISTMSVQQLIKSKAQSNK